MVALGMVRSVVLSIVQAVETVEVTVEAAAAARVIVRGLHVSMDFDERNDMLWGRFKG